MAAIDSLESMPRRCPRAREHEDIGVDLRQLLFGVYRILFVIRDDIVYVVHIRHGARRALTRDDLELDMIDSAGEADES